MKLALLGYVCYTRDTSKPKMSSLQKAEMEWKKKKSEKEQKRKVGYGPTSDTIMHY